MTIPTRIFCLVLVWVSLLLSWGQTNWHDPSLDGVNVNLGYIASDMNGQFENLPLRMSDTNVYRSSEAVTTNLNKHFNSMGVTNFSTNTASALQGAMTSRLTNFFSTNFSGLKSSLPSTNTFDGSGTATNGSWRIYLPGGGFADMDLTLAGNGRLNPIFCSFIRSIIMVINYFIIFTLLAAALKQETGEALNQRQIMGPNLTLGGCNASTPGGLVYAGIITASLGVAFAAVLSFSFFSEIKVLGTGTAVTDALATLRSLPAWEILTAMLPVSAIAVAWTGYFFFRYVLLSPAYLVVRTVILWFSV